MEQNEVKKPTKLRKGLGIFGMSMSLIVAVALMTVIIYLLYVICSFTRLPDELRLEINNNNAIPLESDGEYTIMTYNVGFGAYEPEYTFFMDTGMMKNGKKTQGTHGRGLSKANVQKNIDGAIGEVKKQDADFVIVQEVDFDSTRSYKIDQRAQFMAIPSYVSVYAQNYHSSYLMLPLNDPIGASNSGIVTLSKYMVSDSTRYNFPISDGFGKFTDLDRCFSVTHVPLGAQYLSIISLHMSAYDKGGVIRKQQAELLASVLTKEYEAGNYVIAGGDFNHNLLGEGGLTKFDSDQKVPDWVASYDEKDIPAHFSIQADKTSEVGSCRGADVKWERNKTYTCMIDGFIVSDNIEVKSVKLVDNNFAYADHMPVKLTFSFKAQA